MLLILKILVNHILDLFLNQNRKEKMTVKKVGLKEVKEDLLKVIDKLEALEQKMENLTYIVKRLQQKTGMMV